MDVGDLTERLELKKRLNCKPFSWLLEHIWPELFAYSQDVIAWGSVSLIDFILTLSPTMALVTLTSYQDDADLDYQSILKLLKVIHIFGFVL